MELGQSMQDDEQDAQQRRLRRGLDSERTKSGKNSHRTDDQPSEPSTSQVNFDSTIAADPMILQEQLDEMKSKMAEKTQQVKQLLERTYDSDRLNLELAEQLAKLRLEQAKSSNELRLSEARAEMLASQVNEMQTLNETLVEERERWQREVDTLRRTVTGNEGEAQADDRHKVPGGVKSIEFYDELIDELKRNKTLLEAKENEIQELRQLLDTAVASSSESTELRKRLEEIDRLEHELSIVNTADGKRAPVTSDSEEPEGDDTPQVAGLRRKINRLKRGRETLLARIDNLEAEARQKDDELLVQRKRNLALLSGEGENVRDLFEENIVLNRMLRLRDERIQTLISQLNRHQLVEATVPSQATDGETVSHSDLALMDQLIALGVERDVSRKQVETLQAHLESVQRENQQLQLGMKEILEGIRAGDTTTDLVIECPSLERLCSTIESRFLTSDDASLTKVVLLKSELDLVRGQNEQLRAEVKQLRGEFTNVIEEYTTDILQNWNVQQQQQQQSMPQVLPTVSVGCQTIEEIEENETEESQSIDKSETEEDATEEDSCQRQSRPGKIKTKRRPNLSQRRKMSPKKASTQIVQLEEIGVQCELPMPAPRRRNSWSTVATQTEDITSDIFENIVAPRRRLPETSDCSCQTDVLMKPLTTDQRQQQQQQCTECAKHRQQLDTVRQLMNTERGQVQRTEHAQQQQLEQLQANLELMRKEYQLDMEAKKVELNDLRNKLLASISEHATKLSSRKAKLNGGDADHIEAGAEAMLINMEVENLSRMAGVNRTILESIVGTLQNCLHQKEETVEEYRRMIDDMRRTHAEQINELMRKAEPAPAMVKMSKYQDEPAADDGDEEDSGLGSKSVRLDPVVKELFVKPYLKENEDLNQLLRSTFNQLKIFQAQSRHQIDGLHVELEQKTDAIKKLNEKIENLTKAKVSLEKDVELFATKEKVYNDRIEQLNRQLVDLNNRRLANTAQLSQYKKKVENSIFQESAELRTRISELSAQVRKAEVDRWNVDKKARQERETYRLRLLEREQSLAQLGEQNTKLQALVVKFEKRLLSLGTTKKVEKLVKSTQTPQEAKRVHFGPNTRNIATNTVSVYFDTYL